MRSTCCSNGAISTCHTSFPVAPAGGFRRPPLTTGTMSSPALSLSTSCDRSRFGPPSWPPRKSTPWHAAQLLSYNPFPRASTPASASGGCCCGKFGPRPPPAGPAPPSRPRPPAAGGGSCATEFAAPTVTPSATVPISNDFPTRTSTSTEGASTCQFLTPRVEVGEVACI